MTISRALASLLFASLFAACRPTPPEGPPPVPEPAPPPIASEAPPEPGDEAAPEAP